MSNDDQWVVDVMKITSDCMNTIRDKIGLLLSDKVSSTGKSILDLTESDFSADQLTALRVLYSNVRGSFDDVLSVRHSDSYKSYVDINVEDGVSVEISKEAMRRNIILMAKGSIGMPSF